MGDYSFQENFTSMRLSLTLEDRARAGNSIVLFEEVSSSEGIVGFFFFLVLNDSLKQITGNCEKKKQLSVKFVSGVWKCGIDT